MLVAFFLWGPQRKPNAVFAMGRAAHIRVLTTKTWFWYTYEDSDRDTRGLGLLIFVFIRHILADFFLLLPGI